MNRRNLLKVLFGLPLVPKIPRGSCWAMYNVKTMRLKKINPWDLAWAADERIPEAERVQRLIQMCKWLR